MNNRDEFLQNVRRALGHTSGTSSVSPGKETALSQDAASVESRAKSVRQQAQADSDNLMAQLQESAIKAGWKVARVASAQEVAQYVVSLARDLETRSILRSTHPVLEKLGLEDLLSGSGIEIGTMAIEEDADEAQRACFATNTVGRAGNMMTDGTNSIFEVTAATKVITVCGSCSAPLSARKT